MSERCLSIACFHESDNNSLEIAKQIEILTAGTKKQITDIVKSTRICFD